jgi:hypothetical protein
VLAFPGENKIVLVSGAQYEIFKNAAKRNAVIPALKPTTGDSVAETVAIRIATDQPYSFAQQSTESRFLSDCPPDAGP